MPKENRQTEKSHGEAKKKPQKSLHHVKSGRRGELCRQVFLGFVFCMTFSSMCLCVCVMEVEDKDQTWGWDSNLFLFTTFSSFFFFLTLFWCCFFYSIQFPKTHANPKNICNYFQNVLVFSKNLGCLLYTRHYARFA